MFRSRYYNRLLIQTVVISILPTLIITILLGFRLYSSFEENSEQFNKTAIQQTIERTERQIENVSSALLQVSVNREVLEAITMPDLTVNPRYFRKVYEFSAGLLFSRTANLDIDSVQIIGEKGSWQYNSDIGYQKMDAAAAESLWGGVFPGWSVETRYIKNSYYKLVPSNLVMSVCLEVLGGRVIANINYDELMSGFEEYSSFADIYVIDAAGNLIFDMDEDRIGYPASAYPFYDKLFSGGSSFEYIQDKKNYRGFLFFSDMSGWTYVMIHEAATSGKAFFTDMTLVFVTTLVVLITVILFDLLWSRRLYMPIHAIYNRLNLKGKHDGREDKLDEVRLIEQSVGELIGGNSKLTQQLGIQSDFMRELMIYRLLSGRVESPQDYEQLKQYNVNLPWRDKVLVGIAHLVPTEETADAESKRKYDDVFMIGVTRIVRESLAENALMAPSLIENMAIIVIGADAISDHAFQKYVDSVLKSLHDSVTTHLQVEVAVAVSSRFETPIQIPYAFEQLKNVMRYRLLGGGGIFYAGNRTIGARYPYDLSQSVIEGIRVADKSTIRSGLSEFLKYINQNLSDIRHKEMFLMWFIGDILKLTPDHSSHIVNQAVSPMGKDLVHSILQIGTVEEQSQWIAGHIIHHVVELLHKKDADRASIVKQMIEFIDANAAYDKCYLEACAEFLNYNADYLRKVFKAHVGVSYGQYLNSVILRKAQFLLRNTDSPIGEIAMELGYSNSQNFIRQFKKEFNITPGQFRRR